MKIKIGVQPNGAITAVFVDGKKKTVVVEADARFFDIIFYDGYFLHGKAVEMKKKSDKKKLFKLFNNNTDGH